MLSLPKLWSGFLAGNDRGASCLGPHSGLKMQESRFNAALSALSDPATTTVVLVTRPDPRPMHEAARTAESCARSAWRTSGWSSTPCSTRVVPTIRSPARSRRSVVKRSPRCPSRSQTCRATKCRCVRSTPSVCRRCAPCSAADPSPPPRPPSPASRCPPSRSHTWPMSWRRWATA
nr:hypothetical protein [Nannocystis pusilla]